MGSLKNRRDRKENPRDIPLKMIAELVCDYYGEDFELVKSRSRIGQYVKCRQVIMYLGEQHTRRSLGYVGSFVGRDHATVLHSGKTVRGHMETNERFRSKMVFLTESVLSLQNESEVDIWIKICEDMRNGLTSPILLHAKYYVRSRT